MLHLRSTMKNRTISLQYYFVALLLLAHWPAAAEALRLTIIEADNRSDFTFAKSLKNGRQWLCQRKGARLIPGSTVRTNSSNSMTTAWRSFAPELARARRSGDRSKINKVKRRISSAKKLCKRFNSSSALISSDSNWWLDTGARNSLSEEELFNFERFESIQTLRTDSEETNIHSHYLGLRALPGKAYLFSGEMKRGENSAGVGVTFLSDYPNSDSYYRLRTYGSNNSLHIAPHNTDITAGEVDSGITPSALIWYSFMIYVQDTGATTIIKAKVWNQFESEPSQWQIDCSDAGEDRRSDGLFGVWSMNASWKHWRNLRVSEVSN